MSAARKLYSVSRTVTRMEIQMVMASSKAEALRIAQTERGMNRDDTREVVASSTNFVAKETS